MTDQRKFLCEFLECEDENLEEYIYNDGEFGQDEVNKFCEAMKEYAILMCKKQREICSFEVEAECYGENGVWIDFNSILNSPLPEELQ